ncbi:hypothetical protein AB1K56_03340 [Microbacterium sp. BWR-S6Y]|uniref:hypothetical protein n=1 Tax=Microbacterium sp. BWR-S6Y TaxID=3232073 RepID=UPI003526CB44
MARNITLSTLSCGAVLALALTFTPVGAVFASDNSPAASTAVSDTEGLVSIGTGTYQSSPLAPPTVYEKYMPEVRTDFIAGYAAPGAQVELDLRSLVGKLEVTPTESYRTLPVRTVSGPDIIGLGRIDWNEFAFDVVASPGTSVTSDTTATDGRVRLAALDENASFGVTVTLRHQPSGVSSTPVTITGASGVDADSPFAWVTEAPRTTYEGGIAMWAGADLAEWRNGHYLTWKMPRETITPTGDASVTPSEPRQVVGEAPAGTPAGFGLIDYGKGAQAENPNYRVGVLTGEPTKTVSIDLAERIPGGVSVALPSAESGTLTIPATGGLAVRDGEFLGLDYNAPEGLNISVDGSVITFDFGSAEWLNAAGISVPVLLSDGTRVNAEVRVESLPSNIEGGIVERRIPVETPVTVTDDELLAASRLTGLSPSVAEVQAAELPDGVTRVTGGFTYAGSSEPKTLAFGFTVSELVDTEYGPIRPDATAPGEVRIAVFAAEQPPVDPEQPVTPPVDPEPPVTPEPPVDPEPPVTPETPVTPEQPKPEAPTQPTTPNVRFDTGVAGPVDASRSVQQAQTATPVSALLAGAAGLGLTGLAGAFAALRRRPRTER